MKFLLSKTAYKQYTSITTGNKDLPFDLAQLKLNRNIKHGRLIFENGYIQRYQYGTLVMEVLFGEITEVYHAKKWLRINKFEEKELSHT